MGVGPFLNAVFRLAGLRPKAQKDIRFADKAGIDLQRAAEVKLALNAQKYPVDRFKGSDRKYDE